MSFIIKLPPIMGSLVSALICVAITAALFIIVGFLFRGKRTESTRIFAQQMALRIGTMHALVVSLVFSGMISQVIELDQMSNTEAISAANVYWILKNNQASKAVELRKLIPDYLQTVIEKDWRALYGSSQNRPAMELITRMKAIFTEWKPSASKDEITRSFVLNNINSLSENRSRRVFWKKSTNIPSLIWLIAVLGYFLTIVPYLTVKHSKFRLMLVVCYAIIIGILLHALMLLEDPFLGQILDPTAFEVTLREITAAK